MAKTAAVAVVCMWWSFSLAAQTAADTPRPDVLLITVDTLRPDALGWVAGKNETPNLDALAQGAYRFHDAVAPAPVTLPSHAALLTGRSPRSLGTRDNGQRLGSAVPTLAELFSEAGYRTAAFVSGYPLDASFGLDRGFGVYDDDFSAGGHRGQQLERPAAETTDAALKWLETAHSPWFLWIHYYDPHDPYEADHSAAPGTPDTVAAYHAEVRAVDRAVGRLLEHLSKGSENRLTIFAADHGESLGEHGEQTHGFFIYNSTLSVPLLFHWPSRIRAAQSDAPVALIDIAPTVADLLRLDGLGAVDGKSLARAITTDAGFEDPSPVYIESRRPWTSYGWAPLRGIRWGDWKLIAAPKPELYDLAADPEESENLVDSRRRDARRLADRLRELEQKPAGHGDHGEIDDEAQAKLQSLGYTGAGQDPGEAPKGLPDPKDRIEQWNWLSNALSAMEAGNSSQALQWFDRVLETEPDNPFALSRSAQALLQQKKIEPALKRLQRALDLRPQDVDSGLLLSQTYLKIGRLQDAASTARSLTRYQPGRLGLWMLLAVSEGRQGRQKEATEALRQAVRTAPGRADLRIRLAFAEHSLGRSSEAAAQLQRAADQLGAAFPHAGALGLMYLAAGDAQNAQPWLAQAGPREPELARARFELAKLWLEQGQVERAKRALAEALAADPGLRREAAQSPELADLLSP